MIIQIRYLRIIRLYCAHNQQHEPFKVGDFFSWRHFYTPLFGKVNSPIMHAMPASQRKTLPKLQANEYSCSNLMYVYINRLKSYFNLFSSPGWKQKAVVQNFLFQLSNEVVQLAPATYIHTQFVIFWDALISLFTRKNVLWA